MKKIISILLVFALMATSFSVFAAKPIPEYDHNCLTDCKGECEYSPIVVVHGIMQSQVYVQDKEGNDILTSDGFPIVEGMDMQFMFDMKTITNEIPSILLKLVLSFITGDRDVLVDELVNVVDKAFNSHYFSADGTRENGVHVDEYWYSDEVAMTKPDKSYGYAQGYRKDENGNTLPSYKYEHEYDFIKAQVDITGYCEKAGYDHAYYFAYSSFGDTLETAERLDSYIQMVKEQTGHDKVTVVFISLGGTIGNAYLAKYCDPADIDRIIFAAAATDGSYLLSDLMNAALSFDDSELFYSEMLPLILQLTDSGMDWLGYLLNFVTRAIPQSLFTDHIDYIAGRVIKEVLGNLIMNCPSMWALVPSGEYEALAQKYISDEAHAALKAKTDEYYQIQKNAPATVKKLSDEGMDIFVICGYGLPLPSAIENWDYSSDNIIQIQSTSLGATSAKYGEKLPEGYKPAIDASYISPDGSLDAGTCALPERTWFIKNQSHLKLQSSVEDVIQLCIDIAINKSITDARVNNGGYAQFNEYRDNKGLRDVIRTYENLTEEELASVSAEDKAELDALYNSAVTEMAKRTWSYDNAKNIEIALYTKFYDLGYKDEKPFVRYELNGKLTPFFKALSDFMLKVYGPRDYYTSK
ncbi:MAG: alpha/beta hydrolase [Ruminococcaceae bacterium]|nr:alpha/beta hydrolase [Oscillospiraceae bacterium]